MAKKIITDDIEYKGYVKFLNFVKFRREPLLREVAQYIPTEPQRGMPHKHYALLVDGVDPDTAVTEVDCSAEVPVGAGLVLLHVDVRSTGTIYNITFYGDSGAAAADAWAHAETHSRNDDWHGQFFCGLDADRKFYYQTSHANVDDLTIVLLAYWI